MSQSQGKFIKDGTGTGLVVKATSPTLTNPVVGTQTQGDNSTKAASTAYTDLAVANAVAGINPAVAVQAATTAAADTSGFTYNNGVSGIGATFTGSVNTAVTIDGFTFTTVGQRLLVKNDTQSPSGAFNGVYFLSTLQTGILAPIFTRALDYDTPSDINNTGSIPVVSGTVNTTTSWLQTAQIVSVGVTPLVFVRFTRNPADYLLVANNLSDVASKSTSFNNLSPMTTGGDLIYGGASGTGTRLPNGSAGQILTSAGTTLAPTWSALNLGTPASITGTLAAAQFPALTGDITTTAGSLATTLATVNSNVGTFASVTVNAKGLVTAATALSGDATTSGAALTLATVNANVGTFASVTVNAKGLATAAAALSGDATTSGSVLTLATVNANVGTFASVTVNAKGLVTAAAALSGDATTSGSSLTLATVNANTGSFGSASVIPVITVNGKGLITAVTTASVVATTAFNVLSKTANYTAVANDYVVLSSTAFTVTLPTAVGISGQMIGLQHNGSQFVKYTINTTSAQTVGGIASGVYILYTTGETLLLVSDNANWQVISHKTETSFTSFTPTWTGSTTNPTLPSNSTQTAYWRRDGSDMLINYQYDLVGTATAASAGSGVYQMAPPGTQTIDTTSLVTGTGTESGLMTPIGSGQGIEVGTSILGSMYPYAYDSTHISFGFQNTNANVLSSAYGPFTAAGLHFGFQARIPISGWQP